MIQLEEKCRPCHGTGTKYCYKDDEYSECGECEGHGVVLTKQGQEMVAFINRWVGPKIKEP